MLSGMGPLSMLAVVLLQGPVDVRDVERRCATLANEGNLAGLAAELVLFDSTRASATSKARLAELTTRAATDAATIGELSLAVFFLQWAAELEPTPARFWALANGARGDVRAEREGLEGVLRERPGDSARSRDWRR